MLSPTGVHAPTRSSVGRAGTALPSIRELNILRYDPDPVAEGKQDPMTLRELIEQLEGQGHDTAALSALQPQLDAIEKPRLLTRLTQSAIHLAKTQWGHVASELAQSKEMAGLVSQGLLTKDSLSAKDRNKIKAQLADLVRLVPASLIAVATASMPLPGMVLLTPTLLRRLGLMPSAWREAHIIQTLRAEKKKLIEKGHAEPAESIDSFCATLEEQAEQRESVQAKATLLAHWDANKNGQWDEDEKEAYRAEVAKLAQLASTKSSDRRWFMEYEQEIFGAFCLSEISQAHLAQAQSQTENPNGASSPAFVCYDGKTGWVKLEHLLGQPIKF